MAFYCQMVDYDDEDDWTAVTNFSAGGAAAEYAEHCDSRSAGEVFPKPGEKVVVLVKERDQGEVQRFEVDFEYRKSFYVKLLDVVR